MKIEKTFIKTSQSAQIYQKSRIKLESFEKREKMMKSNLKFEKKLEKIVDNRCNHTKSTKIRKYAENVKINSNY